MQKPGPGVPPPREFSKLDKALRVLTNRSDYSLAAAHALALTLKGDELYQLANLHDQPTGRPDAILAAIAARKDHERRVAEGNGAAEAAAAEPPAAALSPGNHSPDGIPDLDPGDVLALQRWETNGGAVLPDSPKFAD